MVRRNSLFGLIALAALGVALACSNNGSGGGSGGPSGPGVCASACPKVCSADQDCNTTNGELCCNFGNGTQACVTAKACPKFCGDDSMCDTTMGQACVQVSFETSQKVCEPPTQGIHTCSTDNDCATGGGPDGGGVGVGEVCCTNYKQPFCLPANSCPKACAQSTDCDTTTGEICCTSAPTIEPSLSAGGLCLNPVNSPCPTACMTSADCAQQGQLCCNGVCAATCPKACNADTDCDNQICCRTTKLGPAPPHIFTSGPSCAGTEQFTDCTSCGQAFGCTTTRCPGCTSGAGNGSCTSQPTYPTCTECGQIFGCSSCAGCTQGTACGGAPALCTSQFSQATCQALLGCTWNASGDAGAGTCTGVANACTTFAMQNTCIAQSGCAWQSACTGTLTPCAQLTTQLTCQNQRGCLWQAQGGSCTGTLTPCSQLPVNQCTQVPGCMVQQ